MRCIESEFNLIAHQIDALKLQRRFDIFVVDRIATVEMLLTQRMLNIIEMYIDANICHKQ